MYLDLWVPGYLQTTLWTPGSLSLVNTWILTSNPVNTGITYPCEYQDTYKQICEHRDHLALWASGYLQTTP